MTDKIIFFFNEIITVIRLIYCNLFKFISANTIWFIYPGNESTLLCLDQNMSDFTHASLIGILTIVRQRSMQYTVGRNININLKEKNIFIICSYRWQYIILCNHALRHTVYTSQHVTVRHEVGKIGPRTDRCCQWTCLK